MRKEYEITYLLDPKLEAEEKNTLDETVDKLIINAGGDIIHSSPATDTPGSRRRLHYPLQKNRVAWMRMLQTQIDPNKIAGLREGIKKTPRLLRYVIMQISSRPAISAAIFDSPSTKPEAKDKPVAKLPHKEVTMAEVEEKIEKALDEEVK